MAAWRVSGSLWPRSIIALRSDGSALPSAADKKSFSRVNSPILGSRPRTSLRVQRLQVHPRLGGFVGRACTEQARRPFEQLCLLCRDLSRMHVMKLRQLGQCLLALDRSQRHLRFQRRAVFAPCTSRHLPLLLRDILTAVRQGIHLSGCSVLAGHLFAQFAWKNGPHTLLKGLETKLRCQHCATRGWVSFNLEWIE